MKALFGNLKNYKTWLLILAPAILIVVSLRIREIRSFYWLGRNFDPEYAYLLNFLNIANLKMPGHVDHPGTPLQVLGGITLWVTYLFAQQGNLVTGSLNLSVIQNSEIYLNIINLFLLLLIALCQLLVGLVAFRLSNSIVLSLILQSPPFLVTALAASNRVSPEPLLLCIVQVLSLLLLFYLYVPQTEYKWRFSLSLGLLLGLGMAVKITFLPLLLLFLLLPNFRQWRLALFATVTAFILGTSPIIPSYSQVFGWVFSIATHTGRYGTGEQGVIDPVILPKILSQLISQDTIYFSIISISLFSSIILGVCLINSKFKSNHSNKSEDLPVVGSIYRLFACLLLVNSAQIAITLKHPGIHYLIPAMGLSGLLILSQVLLYSKLFKERSIRIVDRGYLSIFALTICCFFALHSVRSYFQQATSFYTPYKQEIEKIDRLIKERYADCTIANYYRASSQAYALTFGNEYAQNNYSEILRAKKYSNLNEINYNIWTGSFDAFGEGIEAADLFSKQCVVLRGTPFEELTEYSPKFEIEPIFIGNTEALYRFK